MYTFEHSLNYPFERSPHYRTSSHKTFPCDICTQEFYEPDDGNMEWNEFSNQWRCGHCLDRYGIGDVTSEDAMTVTFN